MKEPVDGSYTEKEAAGNNLDVVNFSFVLSMQVCC